MLSSTFPQADWHRRWFSVSVVSFLLLTLTLPFVKFTPFADLRIPTAVPSVPSTSFTPSAVEYLKADQLKIQTAADGTLRAWSQVKGLFYPNKATFHPLNQGDWQVAFSLSGVASVSPIAHDNIVEYRYPNGLTEIYENRPEGIEQKFIVSSQSSVHSLPAGKAGSQLGLTGNFYTPLYFLNFF